MSESQESNIPQLSDLWVRVLRKREELEGDLPDALRGGVPPIEFLTPEGCRLWYRVHLVEGYRCECLSLFAVLEAWSQEDVDFYVFGLHVFAETWRRLALELVDLSELIWPSVADKRIWLYEVQAGLVGARTGMIACFRKLANKIEEMSAVPTPEEPRSASKDESRVEAPVHHSAEGWHRKLRSARLKSGLSRRGAANSLKREVGIQITADAIKKHEEGTATPRREVRTGYAQIYATTEGALFPSAE
jgi:hypothetical protein